MAFLVRLISALGLGIVTFVVILVALVLIVFVLNRGLQWFFGMFGYEVEDFFGWFMSKLPIKKKTDKKETE